MELLDLGVSTLISVGERMRDQMSQAGQICLYLPRSNSDWFADDVPKFCRVGGCRYWHTEPKQIWRHRDGHFSDRHGYLCPNRTGTCRNPGWDFRRSDAVIVHCRGSLECTRALEDNRGKIPCWGTPASEEDLRPEDRRFHIPYEAFDGRTRRSRGRGRF